MRQLELKMSADTSTANPANAWMRDPRQVEIAQQAKEDFEWAMQRFPELEQRYCGETVVIVDKRVLGHGVDEGELMHQAIAAGFPPGRLVILQFPTFVESPR